MKERDRGQGRGNTLTLLWVTIQDVAHLLMGCAFIY